jgi:elongation factor Ts
LVEWEKLFKKEKLNNLNKNKYINKEIKMSLASLVKELRERTGAGMMDCKKALEASNNDMDGAIEWLRENGIAKAAKKGDRVAAEGLTKIIVNGNKAVILELNAETDFVSKNDQFLELLEKVATTLVNGNAKTLEEGLALDVDGDTLETLIVNATSTIGEKITLRRFEVVEKTDGQMFADYSHMGGRIGVLALVEGDNLEVARQVCMHVAAINPQFLKPEDVSADVVETERATLTKEALAEGKPENIVEKMVEGRIKKYLSEIVLLEQAFVVDTDKTVGGALKDAGLNLVSAVRYEVGEGIEKNEVDFAEEVAAQVQGK